MVPQLIDGIIAWQHPENPVVVYRDWHDGVRVIGETWAAKFWYDVVPERWRVRIIGNEEDAKNQITNSVRRSDSTLVQTHVPSALREEMDRLGDIPYGAHPLPSTRKGGRKTSETEERAAKDRPVFGDKPVGWARRRKKDQT